MPLSRAAVAAAVAVALAVPATATPSVERCPDRQFGRVVVAGDTTVALCAALYGCGEQGVELWVNDQRVGGACLPFHVDGPPWPDPTLCPIFHALWPGVPGVVDIGAWDGDIYVDGERVYDCPPYGN